MHESEPSLEELKRLRLELYASESTDGNLRKWQMEALLHTLNERIGRLVTTGALVAMPEREMPF